ncbi:MAG: hypothetical protein SO135_04355 [Sphaerochaetaceae bacterium]|jgi:hypothetical protein|nr:hypothetical protein [Sphaerochaetaceae bacterium]
MNTGQWMIVFCIALLLIAIALTFWFVFIGGLDSFEVESTGHCFCNEQVAALATEWLRQGTLQRRFSRLESKIEALDGIADAEVSGSVRGVLKVRLKNEDPAFLLVVRDQGDDGVDSLWQIRGNDVVRIEGRYDEVLAGNEYEMEISSAFLQNLLIFGPSSEFFIDLNDLKSLVTDKSLKITLKYDNNMSGNLGWLIVDFISCDAEISVRERVSSRRLNTALKLVVAQTAQNDTHQVFDLYANALVRRLPWQKKN